MRAIVEDIQANTIWKGRFEILQPRLNGSDELAGIRAAQRENKSLDRLTCSVLRHRPISCQASDPNGRDISKPQHAAVDSF